MFWVDLLVLVLQVIGLFVWHLSPLLFFVKHIQLFESSSFFERCWVDTSTKERAWNLLYLLMTNLLVTNIVAVIFNAMAFLEPVNNWMQK